MKTILNSIFMTLFMTISVISFSQEPGGENDKLTAEERANKRTEKMKSELSLTDAQTKSVYDINLAHILQMDKYREEQKALHEKMKAEKEATRAKLRGVLTTEQAVIFDQKAEEHKQRQEEKHKNSQH